MLDVGIEGKELASILKGLPIKAIITIIAFVSALLLFLPDELLKKLYLLDFKIKFGTNIGIVFLFSACLVVFFILSFFMSVFRDNRIKNELSGDKAIKRISDLSNFEKHLVCYMFYNQAETLYLPKSNPTIAKLKQDLIIIEAVDIGTTVCSEPVYPFRLHPWVIKTVNENPSIISGIPKSLPREFEKYQNPNSICMPI